MKQGDEKQRLVIRLPRDVKTWLRAQASRNSSSQGSEAVRAIRERMDREQSAKSRLQQE